MSRWSRSLLYRGAMSCGSSFVEGEDAYGKSALSDCASSADDVGEASTLLLFCLCSSLDLNEPNPFDSLRRSFGNSFARLEVAFGSPGDDR